MYKSFTIKNYRCFDDITVEPLARVNLIAGENNVGKTALLEALFIHYANDPRIAVVVESIRGVGYRRGEFLLNLFYGFDSEKTIFLSGKDVTDKMLGLEITSETKPVSRITQSIGKKKW